MHLSSNIIFNPPAEVYFFVERNNVPFDFVLESAIRKYEKDESKIFLAKSIYYQNKEDFKAYQTFRCINKRTTLSKPNLDFCCSDEFCAETLL
jgi:hypothetical protein